MQNEARHTIETSIGGTFHHIGVACKNIDESAQFIKATHEVIHDSGLVVDPVQNVELRLFALKNGLQLELISGLVVSDLLRKGVSYYHICYEVDEIEQSINFLTEKHCRIVLPQTPAILFENREIAFMMSPIGLIELLQANVPNSSDQDKN